MGVIIGIEIVVPLVLLGVLAFVRQGDAISFILTALALGTALFFLWLVFPWDVTSIYWRQAQPVLLLAAVILGARRVRRPDKPRSRLAIGAGWFVNAAVLVLMAGLCWRALLGYPTPDGALALASPLPGTPFVVGHGGASRFINGHFKVPPQTHALDILGVNAWGARRQWGADPLDLESYAIFGAWVHAPCAGRVLSIENQLDDLPPGQTDRDNLAGNHVLLDCGGTEVVLAHLRRSSVAVRPGQDVTVGQRLGQVGNSGNTSEPHLHLHAERGGEPGVLLNGQAVPITIDDRFLVRGDVVRP